jgi:hypothetical protein
MRRRRRRSHPKILVVGAVTALAAYAGLVVAPATAAPVFAVAPYVDMTNTARNMLDTAIRSAGLNSYTAAFIIGGGCTPLWGDAQTIDASEVTARIARAERAGARTIIAFGGAAGAELARSCSDTAALTAAYQRVIDKYRVRHLDFAIEGAAITDPTSYNRRYRAINALRGRNPGLVVSLTIPVLESGPDAAGEAFLRAAVSNGTRIDLVNAMAMDYGHPNGGMGAAAISAARGTLAAARRVGLNFTFGNIGVTPMLGRNDTPGETFTTADADELLRFATSSGIGRLSFWSINRDQPCPGRGVSPTCSGLGAAPLAFTRAFTGYRGNPPASESPPGPPPPPGPPGDTTWQPGVSYGLGATATFQGVGFRCIQAHTAQPGWEPPNVPALWQRG